MRDLWKGHKVSDEKYYRTIFVYAKDGEIKCLSPSEANTETLTSNGWVHTATIDPCIWIESLANGSNQSDMLDELQFTK